MSDPRGSHPHSRANLEKRWKQEVRPRNPFNVMKELRARLLETCPYDDKKRDWGSVLVEKALWMAAYNGNGQGSITAMSEIFDRLLGKPVQSTTLDVNVTQTTTERVQDILQSLAVLKADDDSTDDKSRVN